MQNQIITKSITLGHTQHGKSSIGGYLYLHLAKRILSEKVFSETVQRLTSDVSKCMLRNEFGQHLRYALIFDGLRKDIYKDREKVLKTFTTKPFTLSLKTKDEIVELTDLPGHQSFIHLVSGAIELNDIGVFVIDASAVADVLNEQGDQYIDEITTFTKLREGSIPGSHKGQAPKGYRLMLELAQQEAKRKRSREKYSSEKTMKDKMKPPIISGIFNYLCLAWHLGIKNYIFSIHKMDSVDYSEGIFQNIVDFVKKLVIVATSLEDTTKASFVYIPTAIDFSDDFENDKDQNIVMPSSIEMPWYEGPTLLKAFLDLQKKIKNIHESVAEDNPAMFQIDGYKFQSTGKKGQFFKPFIHGYLSSGKLTEGDRIRFSIRNKVDESSGPYRVMIKKKAGNVGGETLLPNRHHTLYLNENELKNIIKNKEANNIFFLGNYIFKDSEKDKKPIANSKELFVSFIYISGWFFWEDFHANLIYGHNRVQAKFCICNEEKNIGAQQFALVQLDESIPLCNMEYESHFGKFVIEKNTFIIGVGTIQRI